MIETCLLQSLGEYLKVLSLELSVSIKYMHFGEDVRQTSFGLNFELDRNKFDPLIGAVFVIEE